MTNTDNRYEEYIELLKANKNLILTGAPGTGKTYLAKKIAEILVGMQTKSYKNEPVNFNEIIEKYIVPNDYLSSSGRVTYHVDKVENNKVFITGDSIQPYAVPFREIETAYKRRLWEGGGRNGFDPYSSAFAKYIYNHVGTEILNINDNKNVEDRSDCIQFVQFHPSYDYTDFVEGLRPTLPDGNGNIGFERKDGVFKDFCKKVVTYKISKNSSYKSQSVFTKDANNEDDRLKMAMDWLMTQDGVTIKSIRSDKEYTLVIKENKIYIRIPKGTENYVNPKGIYRYLKTGEYDQEHQTYEPAIGNFIQNNCPLFANSFSSSLLYKEILPSVTDNVPIWKNEEKENKYYVFIIDEINRGELSKIFGELFFSIDPGYRGKKGLVKTQYQNLITDKSDPFYDGFYVPENVYIIGTMNDIDRSVESMDFAMRRRFAWKEVRADENTGMLDGLGSMKLDVVAKMNRLNEAIWNDATNDGIEGLSRAYHIGGAYFRKLKLYLNDDFSNKDEAYRKLWDNHLRGVLFEYLRGSIDAAENMKMLENVYFSE